MIVIFHLLPNTIITIYFMLFQPFQLDGICMTKMINRSRFSLNKTREIEINLKRLSSMEQDLSVVELLYFSE